MANVQLNANASVAVELDGTVTINTGTDSSAGAEFGFTPDGRALINGQEPPLNLNPVAFVNDASDGSIIMQTGNESLGPTEVFVFGTDGKINGVDLVALKDKVDTLSSPSQPTQPTTQDDSGWIAPTLIGSFVNLGNTAVQTMAPVGYRKIGKQIQLRGIVKNTAAVSPNTVTGNIFKLPAGFYPGRQLQFIVPSRDKPISLKVQTDGYVYVIGADPDWTSLDSVSFLVD